MPSKYPNSFDTPENLYTVKDSLKATLARDWNPGDSVVFVNEDISRFPPTGIITLIEQCSSSAVSLQYRGKNGNSFWNIEPAEGSVLIYRPKKTTKVVMQLRAEHHNAIIDSVIEIEKFLGTKRDFNEHTLLGRLNHLQKLIYTPKAWFEVDKTAGLVPLTVTFTSESQGIRGPVGEVTYEWDFGDGTNAIGPEFQVTKTYTEPGIFDVTLTVYNLYGEDQLKLIQIIKARIEAPNEAAIKFQPQMGQIISPGIPDGGPYEIYPVLRTPVNQFVLLDILNGENVNTPDISFAGEYLGANKKALDPITHYTWVLGDDLPHGNAPSTKAAYSIGGMHDLVIRVDTLLGSYRITNYENCIDVVEQKNLWLWDKSVRVYEFGLYSETFKVRPTTTQQIKLNDSFLDDVPNSLQQKQEFRRNNGFASKDGIPSGNQGTCILFWASGRDAKDSVTEEKINFLEYNAFTDVYYGHHSAINRTWNWASLVSPTDIYFILGVTGKNIPTMSPTNQERTDVNLATMAVQSYSKDGYAYVNGGQELGHNPSDYDDDGNSISGHFSVYRTAWKDYVGYLLRNDGVGEHFMLRNFYKTDGTIGTPFMNLMKLTDAPAGRREGELVSLASGIFFFSNDSAAYVYKPETATWEVSPTSPSIFRGLHDSRMKDYDNPGNRLLVASDGERRAYLSFDYSSGAFMRFNEADLTFNAIGTRPTGEQWEMSIY
jgi:PKD repeat protein